MYRIDNATSSATPPLPPPAGTEQYFQDNFPGGGTIVPAWFLTMIQEEIRQVVIDAGLTPSKTDNGQLSEAVQALVKDGFAPNPYAGEESVTLPNGLIMKFGKLSTPDTATNDEHTITFGTAFPNAIMSIVITPLNDDLVNDDISPQVWGTPSTSAVTFRLVDNQYCNYTYWQAIGY